ncbi:MAG: flavin reductase family protein [Cyclobacteriaceae bacterium]|jgi:flavin reductase (DIM6/NTAB) family NADH-FMN oxidoreductase RutF
MMNTKQKPWNRVDQPVYSISSFAHGKSNMNICTYAVPVSLKPKQFIVAVYHGTRTLTNVQANPEFLLQYLTRSQARLVNLLGKKSGDRIDKMKRLSDEVAVYNGFHYLRKSMAFVHLRVLSWMPAGDHDCALCEVVAYKNLNDSPPLTLRELKKQGIISVK